MIKFPRDNLLRAEVVQEELDVQVVHLCYEISQQQLPPTQQQLVQLRSLLRAHADPSARRISTDALHAVAFEPDSADGRVVPTGVRLVEPRGRRATAFPHGQRPRSPGGRGVAARRVNTIDFGAKYLKRNPDSVLQVEKEGRLRQGITADIPAANRDYLNRSNKTPQQNRTSTRLYATASFLETRQNRDPLSPFEEQRNHNQFVANHLKPRSGQSCVHLLAAADKNILALDLLLRDSPPTYDVAAEGEGRDRGEGDVRQSALPFFPDDFGDTPVMVAVKNNALRTARFLLAFEHYPDMISQGGKNKKLQDDVDVRTRLRKADAEEENQMLIRDDSNNSAKDDARAATSFLDFVSAAGAVGREAFGTLSSTLEGGASPAVSHFPSLFLFGMDDPHHAALRWTRTMYRLLEAGREEGGTTSHRAARSVSGSEESDLESGEDAASDKYAVELQDVEQGVSVGLDANATRGLLQEKTLLILMFASCPMDMTGSSTEFPTLVGRFLAFCVQTRRNERLQTMLEIVNFFLDNSAPEWLDPEVEKQLRCATGGAPSPSSAAQLMFTSVSGGLLPGAFSGSRFQQLQACLQQNPRALFLDVVSRHSLAYLAVSQLNDKDIYEEILLKSAPASLHAFHRLSDKLKAEAFNYGFLKAVCEGNYEKLKQFYFHEEARNSVQVKLFVDRQFENTALHWAAQNDFHELCAHLLKSRSDPMKTNKQGQIPADLAPQNSALRQQLWRAFVLAAEVEKAKASTLLGTDLTGALQMDKTFIETYEIDVEQVDLDLLAMSSAASPAGAQHSRAAVEAARSGRDRTTSTTSSPRIMEPMITPTSKGVLYIQILNCKNLPRASNFKSLFGLEPEEPRCYVEVIVDSNRKKTLPALNGHSCDPVFETTSKFSAFQFPCTPDTTVKLLVFHHEGVLFGGDDFIGSYFFHLGHELHKTPQIEKRTGGGGGLVAASTATNAAEEIKATGVTLTRRLEKLQSDHSIAALEQQAEELGDAENYSRPEELYGGPSSRRTSTASANRWPHSGRPEIEFRVSYDRTQLQSTTKMVGVNQNALSDHDTRDPFNHSFENFMFHYAKEPEFFKYLPRNPLF
ncbi:unnamed protein product [Amoebophrya sp. A120]|nr:unnamed protein product [Amoebophrya sp. A120]|eukprot:GSA120T00006213001.1